MHENPAAVAGAFCQTLPSDQVRRHASHLEEDSSKPYLSYYLTCLPHHDSVRPFCFVSSSYILNIGRGRL